MVEISPTAPSLIFSKMARFGEWCRQQKPETRDSFFSFDFLTASSTFRIPGASTATGFSQKTCLSTSTARSEEHTSELQSLMRISYAVFCLKKKKYKNKHTVTQTTTYVLNI